MVSSSVLLVVVAAIVVVFYLRSKGSTSTANAVAPVATVAAPAAVAAPAPAPATLAPAVPAGPSVSGYAFYPGKDSSGNDLEHLSGGAPAQLAAACSSIVNCKGFNSTGWLKSALLPTAEWTTWTNDPNQGLYVRSS